MKRRSFLITAGGAVGGAGLVGQATTGARPSTAFGQEWSSSGLPRRALAGTGETLSIVGFPGLGLTKGDQQQGTEAIHRAFDKGVNYFDVAPAYGNGDAEVKMGIGLRAIDRGKIFLACKTKMRDKAGARVELERSLTRLKTDHFDLYQMHCLKYPEEVRHALGPGGALETFLKAKEEGKVRYLGFSAHTTKAALEALKGFRFDTVMFPISFVEYFLLGFGKPVLELAAQQQTAVLAIKPLSRGAWPKGVERTRKYWYRLAEDPRELDLAWRFTLSQPGVVAGIPAGWFDILDKTIAAAQSYRPITAAETEELRKLAATCQSLFRPQEQEVACGGPPCDMPYPHGPLV